MENLKPCPFCGNEKITIAPVIMKASDDEILKKPVSVLAVRIHCDNCGASMVKYEKPTKEMWRLQYCDIIGTFNSEDNKKAWKEYEEKVWKPAIEMWNTRSTKNTEEPKCKNSNTKILKESPERIFAYSKLETRWASFFNYCGIEWEFNPERFRLKDGTYHTPSFLIHSLVGRFKGDLFVEVVENPTKEYAKEIHMFNNQQEDKRQPLPIFEHPLLVVGDIFSEGHEDYVNRCIDYWSNHGTSDPEFFSYAMIDGDSFGCVLGINHNGETETFGADSGYICYCDRLAVESAFQKALSLKLNRLLR